MKLNNITIYAPYSSKIVVTNTKNNFYKKIYILDKSKKFIFITKNILVINKWANSIVIRRDKYEHNILSTHLNKITKEFHEFLYSWNSYFFNKIKFKGKGFRIKFFKKIKLIKFYFGRSHKTFIFLKKVKKKRVNKYKFILFSLNKQRLKNISKKITKIKKVNFYTLRGIRISKQIILKRKGKKGTYI